MSNLKDAKRELGEALDDIDNYNRVHDDVSFFIRCTKKHITNTLALLDKVEEEKHHPMEIRRSLEVRGEIKRQDDAAKKEMYGRG